MGDASWILGAARTLASALGAALGPGAPGGGEGRTAPGGPASERPPGAGAEPLRGVTVASVEDLERTLGALDAFSFRPATRLVLDVEHGPEHYARAVRELSARGPLMAELVDSSQLAGLGLAEARSRAAAFAEAFGAQVDIWEVGNEINGEWAGRNPKEILAKVSAMAEEAVARGGAIALTFNLWTSRDCYAKPWEAQEAFIREIPARLAGGVDYVFLSAYETVCEPPQRPDAALVSEALASLGRVFPRARLGMGEIGAQGVEDGLKRDPSAEEKRALARRWISMDAELARRLGERYVSGWFWWYFVEDVARAAKGESIGAELEGLLAGITRAGGHSDSEMRFLSGA